MRLEEYFQLSLEDRIAREQAMTMIVPLEPPSTRKYTLSDYYETGDSVSFLEKLRTYQLNDIMGRRNISKYKLF